MSTYTAGPAAIAAYYSNRPKSTELVTCLGLYIYTTDVNGNRPEVEVEFFDFVLTTIAITMEFLFTF